MNKRIYIYLVILLTPFISVAQEDIEYEESFVYDYMFEPFLQLDSIIDETESFQITHCSAQDDKENWIDYRSLGNCLYSQIPFFEEDESSLKEVIAHIKTPDAKNFNLSMKWKNFSLTDVWDFYRSESNESLIGAQMIIESAQEPLNNLLRSIWKINQQENGMSASLADQLSLIIFNEVEDIYKLQLRVSSFNQEQNKVELILEFQGQEDNVLFSGSIETDYYIGANKFFVRSGE